MDPALRGGRVGGLLRGASPAAEAAVPFFEVLGFEVEDGTCRYTISVLPSPGEDRLEVDVRWSEMETVVKELRGLFPEMPDELGLPKYYFKTTDDAKLEQRRQELSDFWDGFMRWIEGHSRTSAEQLLDSSPLQRMLEDAHRIRDGTTVAAPAVVGAHSVGSGGYSSRGEGIGALSAPRVSLGSERCLFSSRRGEMVGKADFELIASLGEGSFGRVMLCRRTGRGPDGGTLYAMKALDKERVLSDETLEENTEREKQILAMMTNERIPFCVGLKYAFQTPSNLYFVMDFCQGGELFFHLKTMGKFSEVWARFYAAQLVLALGAIHEHRIIYRDLKPENVLLDLDGYIKITDFGLSKQDDALSTIDGTGTLCGTAAYMAPELITNDEYGMAVDWWSLGCLLYEMLDGYPPFHSANALEERSRIINPEIEPSYRGYSADAVDILRRGLLLKDPDRRFRAIEAKRHPFFGSIDWRKLESKSYSAPVVPTVRHELDLSNFDTEFTDAKLVESMRDAAASMASTRHFSGFTFRHDTSGGGGFAGITQALRDDRLGGGGARRHVGVSRPASPALSGGGKRLRKVLA